MVSKAFGRLFHNRLDPYLELRGALPDPQNGFRTFRATDDNVLYLMELIRRVCSGASGPIYIIFIDIRAAFPSVDHKILLDVLASERFGIRGRPLRMIRAMLSDTSSRIVVGDFASDPVPKELGVSQGGINAPKKFDVHFTSTVESLKDSGLGVAAPYGEDRSAASPSAFADDLFLVTDDPAEIAQMLYRVWCHATLERRLELAHGRGKCAVVMVTTDPEEKRLFATNTWSVGGGIVAATDVYRCLGLPLGKVKPNPNWKAGNGHPRFVPDWSTMLRAQEVQFRARTLQLLRSTCNWGGHSIHAILALYKALLRPILDFATPFMGLQEDDIASLNTLQWWALRQFLCGGSHDKRRFPEAALVLETAVVPWGFRYAELLVRTFYRIMERRIRGQGCRRTALIFAHFQQEFHACTRRTGRDRLGICKTIGMVRSGEHLAERIARRRNWLSSVASDWVAAFGKLGLVPSWGLDSLPPAAPRCPAPPARIRLLKMAATRHARGEPSVPPPDFRNALLRHCAWAMIVGDRRRSSWSVSINNSLRMGGVRWQAFQSGPVPHCVPALVDHRLGTLVRRLLRFNTLPVQAELIRCRWQAPRDVRPLSSTCPCCSSGVEDAHHFVFICPTFSSLRATWLSEGAFALSPSPALRSVLDGIGVDPCTRLALVVATGPSAWPSHWSTPFAVPLHGSSEKTPRLGREFDALDRKRQLLWSRLTTFFLAQAWSARQRLLYPSTVRASCDGILRSLMGPPLGGPHSSLDFCQPLLRPQSDGEAPSNQCS